MPHLLLVEDDVKLGASLRREFVREGFAVTLATDGAEALSRVRSVRRPDALVVDIGLPDADGRDVYRALRTRGIDAPVLFLTARDTLEDRLAGFEAGGSDYLTKPFHLSELIARVWALMRLAARPVGTGGVAIGDISLDVVGRRLARTDGEEVALTPTEVELLAALIGRAGGVVERAELVRAGWADGAHVHDNTLDQYVVRLRRKLRALGTTSAITTVRGVGYRLR